MPSGHEAMQATYEDTAVLELYPSGHRIRIRPPALKASARLLRLALEADGDPLADPPVPAKVESLATLMEEFGPTLDIEAELEAHPLLPAELLVTVTRFFWLARSPSGNGDQMANAPAATPVPTAATPAPDSSGSTTS